MACHPSAARRSRVILATLYEVPIGGAQVAAFVWILLGSLVLAAGAGALIERTPARSWVWNVPLFTLGLWACLGLLGALYWYGL